MPTNIIMIQISSKSLEKHFVISLTMVIFQCCLIFLPSILERLKQVMKATCLGTILSLNEIFLGIESGSRELHKQYVCIHIPQDNLNILIGAKILKYIEK